MRFGPQGCQVAKIEHEKGRKHMSFQGRVRVTCLSKNGARKVESKHLERAFGEPRNDVQVPTLNKVANEVFCR